MWHVVRDIAKLMSMRHTRQPYDEAHEKLIAALRAINPSQDAMTDSPQALHYAREAIVSVWPVLPTMIDSLLGKADARIFSREDLRKLLANFAVELLIQQSGAANRWINAKHRARAPRAKKGSRR